LPQRGVLYRHFMLCLYFGFVRAGNFLLSEMPLCSKSLDIPVLHVIVATLLTCVAAIRRGENSCRWVVWRGII